MMAAALVEYGVLYIAQGSESAAPLFLVGWTFNLLIYPVYTGALILLMAKRAQRETPTNKELTSTAIKVWHPLFMLNIISSGLKALGYMLLIVPGIYLSVKISFAEYHLVLEGRKPIEAIQKSFETTRPYFLPILILKALFVIPLFLLTIALGVMSQNLNLNLVLNLILSTLLAFLSLFVDVVMFRVYMSARQGPAL